MNPQLLQLLMQLFGGQGQGLGSLASLFGGGFGSGAGSAGVGGNMLLGGQNSGGNALTGSPGTVGGMQPVSGASASNNIAPVAPAQPSGQPAPPTNMLTQLFSFMPQSGISSASSPLSNNAGFI